MKIVVIGAGQVGQAVALELSEDHDITVVDQSSERLDKLRFAADVLTFEGDGGSLETLQQAGVDKADIVIASTDNDRVNILVCGIAKMIHDEVFTIARVADSDYLKAWQHTRKGFDVNLMVGSNLLTAVSMIGVVSEEYAREVEFFNQGRIEMAEFILPTSCGLVDKAVKDLDVPSDLRFAALFKGDSMEVVSGDTVLNPGARLLVIGTSEGVHRFGKRLARPLLAAASKESKPRRLLRKIRRKVPSARSLFILGGGELGFQLASSLEERKIPAKIIEIDKARAHFLASRLPKSFVLHGDVRDPELLRNEGVGRADIVISALRPDELNLFACLQALHLGASRVISVVHEQRYQPLFAESGIELTFNPRKKVIEEIIRHTRCHQVEKVSFVESHQAEVLEIKLKATSLLVGRPLKESAPELPKGLVIGAISRGGQVIIPDGDTTPKADDDLVILAQSSIVTELLEKL